MNIRKTTLLFSLALTLFVGGLTFAGLNSASAAYNGANIIDNGVFLNANSMSAAQIQSFLSSKGSGLASRSFTMQCSAAGSTANQLYISAGAPCNQNTSSANIIYYASRIYGVNPQVILATIQKEQSLVTTGNPTIWQLTQAMGYGCPTTGSCDTSSSFFYQIDNGTWVLRYHYERANGNNSWWSPSSSWVCGTEKNFYKPNLYPGQNVRFYDGNNVNYRTYYIENAATSAFYCYTPHAYNNPQGLYGRPAFGTTGQYYSGSYNFVSSFEEWFGSMRYDDTNVAHPNGTLVSDGQKIYRILGNTRQWITNPSVFNSMGYTWNRVKPATIGDNNLPLGSNLDTLASGTLFSMGDGRIYVTDYFGGVLKKQWLSYSSYVGLGYNGSDVMSVPAVHAPSVTENGVYTSLRHPSGTLIQSTVDRGTYLMDQTTLRHVMNPTAFLTNNFSWAKIKQSTAADLALASGTPVDVGLGSVLWNNNNLYIVDYDVSGPKKRAVTPWECFNNRWRYTSADWVVTPNSALPTRNDSIFTC